MGTTIAVTHPCDNMGFVKGIVASTLHLYCQETIQHLNPYCDPWGGDDVTFEEGQKYVACGQDGIE